MLRAHQYPVPWYPLWYPRYRLWAVPWYPAPRMGRVPGTAAHYRRSNQSTAPEESSQRRAGCGTRWHWLLPAAAGWELRNCCLARGQSDKTCYP
jgi:hypothetical protein